MTASRPSLRQLIRADIEATTHANFRKYSTFRFWSRSLVKTAVSPNVRVVIYYRLSHFLAGKGLLPIALLIRARGIRISGAELNPLAEIGPGLYVAHSVGVGVGAYVKIGANCTMFLGAVIGPQPGNSPNGPQYTTIGDNVVIGTHAVVLGGVHIGDGAVIGANSVIMRDVEPDTVVSAAPARPIWRRSPTEAAPEASPS